VISRSSGDRTLLQLPSAFTNSSSVTDMAVYGNRLAGVTSDGGFVVWELPEVITDDVPCASPTTLCDHGLTSFLAETYFYASHPPPILTLSIPSSGIQTSRIR